PHTSQPLHTIFLYAHRPPSALHSFPTRRSSDLIRKNGVPYSDKAVLTEYVTLLPGQQNDSYIALTAFVDDPTYLTGQFIRTYNLDRKSTRLNSSHLGISYAVFCLKKKNRTISTK